MELDLGPIQGLERREGNNRFEHAHRACLPRWANDFRLCNGDSSTRILWRKANVSMAPGDLSSYMFAYREVKGAMAPPIDPLKHLSLFPLGLAAKSTKRNYNDMSGKLLVTRQKKSPIIGGDLFRCRSVPTGPKFRRIRRCIVRVGLRRRRFGGASAPPPSAATVSQGYGRCSTSRPGDLRGHAERCG